MAESCLIIAGLSVTCKDYPQISAVRHSNPSILNSYRPNCLAQLSRSRVGRPIIPNPLKFLCPELMRVSTKVLLEFPGDSEKSYAGHTIPILMNYHR